MRTKASLKVADKEKYLKKNPDEFATLSEKILCARINMGKTQKQVARKVGISDAFLSEVENGKKNISDPMTMKNLEIYFGFRPYYLTESLKKPY